MNKQALRIEASNLIEKHVEVITTVSEKINMPYFLVTFKASNDGYGMAVNARYAKDCDDEEDKMVELFSMFSKMVKDLGHGQVSRILRDGFEVAALKTKLAKENRNEH